MRDTAHDTVQHGLNSHFNAWVCKAQALVPARLLVESMDSDHTSRSLTPVALASGGYVDLMNAGWDHQRAKDCGGYGCLSRLMTFHTTVAVNRSYDLTFTGTNPQSTRLMLPSGAGHRGNVTSARVIISITAGRVRKKASYFDRLLGRTDYVALPVAI